MREMEEGGFVQPGLARITLKVKDWKEYGVRSNHEYLLCIPLYFINVVIVWNCMKRLQIYTFKRK